MLACLLLFIYILSLCDLIWSHGLKSYKYANSYTCIYRCDFTSLSFRFIQSITYLTSQYGRNMSKMEILIPQT